MNTLTLKGIRKKYGAQAVLKGISLSVEKGKSVGIVGPSGAGKTTLLRIINLLEQPTVGYLSFNGTRMGNGVKRMAVQRSMAMVFQKPVLFDDSVLGNVSYGLRIRGVTAKDAREKALSALAGLGIHDVYRNARKISGGEAERVAFCQAAIAQPDLLLLDEPTANLDGKNVKLIEAQIMRMRKEHQTTIIIASHDQRHMRAMCDEVYTLQDGKLRR